MKEGTIAPIPVTTEHPTIFAGTTVIAQHEVLNKWINEWSCYGIQAHEIMKIWMATAVQRDLIEKDTETLKVRLTWFCIENTNRGWDQNINRLHSNRI